MKALFLAFKDIRSRFRDLRAWLYMLVAPLVLALIMGAAFGGQRDGASPIYAIPLAVVNADQGPLGATFVAALEGITVDTTSGPQSLFALTLYENVPTARAAVERGEVRGVVVLPPNFSAALQTPDAPTARVQVLLDPTVQVAPMVIRSAVERLVLDFQATALASRLVALQTAPGVRNLPQAFEGAVASTPQATLRLRHQTLSAGEAPDALGYFMPAMAVFFLMFTVFAGMRSILSEAQQGTLARLMTTPISSAEILLGKIVGALLTGLLQMAVLVLVSGSLFGVHWGNPWGVTLLSLSTVLAAAGLGALLTTLARDDHQASILGTLVALVFGILGGNFIALQHVPSWLDWLSKATLNRWALDGFTALALDNAPLHAVLPHIGVLLTLALVCFALALPGFRRRFTR